VSDDKPANFAQLRVRLQREMPKLAAGQRRIAELILDDPEGMAFRSIGESAEAAGVHASSLVRFAARLGLSGYPELVRLCRAQLASEAQLVRRLDQATRHGAGPGNLAAIAERDGANLTRTLARVDPTDWDAAVTMLAEAPTVHVIGLRKCFAVAYLMSYLLHLVRPRVRQLGVTSGLLVDDLRDIGAGDVVVAASIRRYAADTVRALDWARRGGARTIALTDDPSSPLAAVADVAFYVETGSVTILRSLTAFVSLVQALATAVAVRLGAGSREELAVDERLLDEFDMYLTTYPEAQVDSRTSGVGEC
jgi:DNA-binding MurR/RpiR family transcriptional regulator